MAVSSGTAASTSRRDAAPANFGRITHTPRPLAVMHLEDRHWPSRCGDA
jgi:hypothetical protein